MIEKYNEIFVAYKKFMEDNSKYNPRIVKYNTNTSTYFPVVTFVLSNSINTNNCTLDKIENYDQHYYTINIFTKDKINEENETVASQIVNEELTSLTIQFFEKINMKRTLCNITPNLDYSILRRTLQFQCLVGSVRGNIIRR